MRSKARKVSLPLANTLQQLTKNLLCKPKIGVLLSASHYKRRAMSVRAAETLFDRASILQIIASKS